MSDRDERGDQSGRPPAEGVRIIKAEEAQAALDAGEAAGRRPGDQLRFGDVPPAPSGPRPAHRFPLPDSVDPAGAVELPPLAQETGARPVSGRRADNQAGRSWRPPPPPPEGEAGRAESGRPRARPRFEIPVGDGGDAGAPRPDVRRAGAAGSPPARSWEPADHSGADPRPEEADPDEPPRSHQPRAAEPDAGGAHPEWGSGADDRTAEMRVVSASESPPDLPPAPPAAADRRVPEPGLAEPGTARPRSAGTPPVPEPPARPPAPGSAEAAPGAPAAPPADAVAAPPVRPAPKAGPAPAGGDHGAPPAGGDHGAPTAAGAGYGAQPSTGGYGARLAAGTDDSAESAAGSGYGAESAAGTGFGAGSQPGAGPAEQNPTGHPGPPPEWVPAGRVETRPERSPGPPAGPLPSDVPEEGINVAGAPTEMPHWADPPTGEVPRLRFDDDPDGDDLEAWRALGTRGARWRDENGWDEADSLDDLAGEAPVGALDQTRAEHSDLYSFDEDFARVTDRTASNPVVDLSDTGPDADDPFEDLAAASHGARRARSRGRSGRGRPVPPRSRGGRGATPARAVDLDADDDRPVPPARRSGPSGPSPRRPAGEAPTGARPARSRSGSTAAASRASESGGRALVGVGLVALLLIAYAVGPAALVALATVVILAAAGEAYNMTRSAGFRPATLLGLVATVGSVLAAYWRGGEGIAVTSVLLFIGAIFWFVLGVEEARPLANVAVTVMVFVWVAVLGSFASVMLKMGHGKGLFLGAVVTAVAADIGAFFVGRTFGRHQMAPAISPNKTVEGYLGGVVAALIVGVIVGKAVAPWGGIKHGLVLGLVVGLVAPFGDLFESLIKRDLGVKDSGRLLGGHGGVLDRFDALLVALPVAYFVATLFKL